MEVRPGSLVGSSGDVGSLAEISGATCGRILLPLLLSDGCEGYGVPSCVDRRRRSVVFRFFVIGTEMSCSLLRALAGIFCFLHVFFVVSVGGSAVRWWLLEGWSTTVSFAGDSATAVLFFAFVFCVVCRICHVLLCAGCLHTIHGAAGPATTEKAARGGRKMVYQLATEKSGWSLLPTCFGGSITLWVVLSSGDSEFLADLDAPDLWSSGEVMAESHLQPGRSTFLRYVDVLDILILVAIKNYVSSSGRGSASNCKLLRSPATRTAGKHLQGPSCNFLISQGCLCKNVNFKEM
ncbi:unnamed protein product [Urochloa humidicola]